jgi:hypothetical protein
LLLHNKRQYQEDSKYKEESQDWDDSEDKGYSDEEFAGDMYGSTDNLIEMRF